MSESVAGQLDEVHLLENVWEDFRVDEAADESSDGFVVVDVTGELLVAAEERQAHGGEAAVLHELQHGDEDLSAVCPQADEVLHLSDLCQLLGQENFAGLGELVQRSLDHSAALLGAGDVEEVSFHHPADLLLQLPSPGLSHPADDSHDDLGCDPLVDKLLEVELDVTLEKICQ